MSRHRDIRCINHGRNDYDDLEDYDDVYGHSVEDDIISPSAQQFMFDRSKQSNIASFFTEPDIKEDDEEVEEDIPSSFKLPQLSDIDTAKLISCSEAVKNVIGDTHPESEINRKIIEFNYNTEAVLNSILNGVTINQDKKAVISEAQTDSTPFNIRNQTRLNNSNMEFKKHLENDEKPTNFSSLSEMISKTSKPSTNSNQAFKSLSDLTSHHLKISENKVDSPSQFKIPKMSFNKLKPSSTDSDEPSGSSFPFSANCSKQSSHADKAKHNNESLETKKSETSAFSSLADLTAHHLKISEKKNQLKFPNFSSISTGLTDQKMEDGFSNSLANLSIQNLKSKQNICILNSAEPELPNNTKRVKLESYDFSNFSCPKSSRVFENIDPNQQFCDIFDLESDTPMKEIHFNSTINPRNSIKSKKASSFGRILCKNYQKKQNVKKDILKTKEKVETIIHFDFSSPSPDSIILSRLIRKME